MAAQYTNITQHEIEAFLLPQKFEKINLPNTVELVYAKRINKDGLALSLRIYTGINPSGQSREKGEDAIRVNVFCKRTDGQIRMVIGSKRVHRVKGWKTNLQKRIDEMSQALIKVCPKCGNSMVLRHGKNGDFFGCSSYPACKGTMSDTSPPQNPRHDWAKPAYNPSQEECQAEQEMRNMEEGE